MVDLSQLAITVARLKWLLLRGFAVESKVPRILLSHHHSI